MAFFALLNDCVMNFEGARLCAIMGKSPPPPYLVASLPPTGSKNSKCSSSEEGGGKERRGSLQWQQRAATESEAVDRVAVMKNRGWKQEGGEQGGTSKEH
eukprot:scaffold59400_cov20-Tisochrysis_lutea.AAC.2